MKVIATIYRDKLGRLWSVRKESLPKKKGSYDFWIGSLLKDDALNEISTIAIPRQDTKGDILKYITDLK